MDRFAEIAKRHGVALIEDCSHAHGARYRDRHVGSWGDVGCFSLQGPKAVSGGEAGIAVTSDAALFDRMLLLGHYGRLKSGQAKHTFDTDHLSLGVKYRPHLYAILLALGSLSRLEELNRRRQRNYDVLCAELAGCAAVQPIATTVGATRGGFLEFILRFAIRLSAGGARRGRADRAGALREDWRSRTPAPRVADLHLARRTRSRRACRPIRRRRRAARRPRPARRPKLRGSPDDAAAVHQGVGAIRARVRTGTAQGR
jgi:hypothetical protein